MLTRIITVLTAVGISVTALTMVAPTTVLAYPPCITSSTASVSSPTVRPGGTVTFTVTMKDCNGVPVNATTVTFTSTGPGTCQAIFSSPSAVTDANGQATTTPTFPVGCPGQYTLTGTSQGLSVTAAVRETGGFPLTSASRGADRRALPLLGLLLVGLGVTLVAGGSAAFIGRR